MNTQTAVAINGMNLDGAMLLTSKAGKPVGARVMFGEHNGQRMSAVELKAVLKAANPLMKGKELTLEVNKVLTGSKDVAWARHDAMTSAFRSAGYIPNSTDIRNKTAAVKFVRVDEEKKVISREEALAALGLSEAALNAMLK